MRRARLRMMACLSALFLAAPLGSQTPPQGASPTGAQNPPALAPLRVTTRLVQVNVIAEKDGKPFPGLTKDDFELLDKGERQQIAYFSMETYRTLANAAVAAPDTPANIFSNRLEQKPGVPTAVTVILLDGLNTKFADMAYAKQQIIKFLSKLQPQDRVALYALTTRLIVLHEFTSDASSLLRAINRYQNHESVTAVAGDPEEADTGDDQLDQFLNNASLVYADYVNINRAYTTAEALKEIADHVAHLPGRKNLIWVSSSFPFAIGIDDFGNGGMDLNRVQTFSDVLERAAKALNNANLAVYPVDARGLIPPQFSNQPMSARSVSRGKSPIRMRPPQGNFDTMNMLADRTGGRALYNNNDIAGMVRRAIEDSQVSYVLGYYPTHNQWDGKWRELKVQVTHPGVHVRFRRGYFALPDTPSTPDEKKAIMREAVFSPLDYSNVGLNVRVDGVDVPGARTLKTELQIEPRDLSLQLQSDRWVGGLEVLYVQKDAEGKQLSGESQQIDMHLTKDTYDSIMKKGLMMGHDLRVAPGAAQLRILARDATTGSIGSVSVSLDRIFAARKN